MNAFDVVNDVVSVVAVFDFRGERYIGSFAELTQHRGECDVGLFPREIELFRLIVVWSDVV